MPETRRLPSKSAYTRKAENTEYVFRHYLFKQRETLTGKAEPQDNIQRLGNDCSGKAAIRSSIR